MTRVLLINPPSPERQGAPLLGQQYVAAALLARGCEVRIIDGAANCLDRDEDWLVAEALAFSPDLIGLGLTSRWVWHTYRFVEKLRGTSAILVAGGVHATVCPAEALDHGFDIVLAGEAERSIVALIDCVEGQARLAEIPGASFRDANDHIRHGPAAQPIVDLDLLAPPSSAQHLYNPGWYNRRGLEVVPGGIVASRGCPSRCIFCANHVTGRRFRHRSVASVITEINYYHDRYGQCFFPFWDDAFTANLAWTHELCSAMERDIHFPLAWSAITRVNMVTPNLLAAMKRAGLVAVNFGVESGDDQILKAIKKGITTGQVVRAIEAAKELGLRTICNFMLGFPQETPAALERTLAFMKHIAPLVNSFSTLGVVVPYPGTALYAKYHRQYGFSRWWLREEYSRHTPPPPYNTEAYYQYYREDRTLDLDFFHYTEEVRGLIQAALRFKADHNLKNMTRSSDPPATTGVSQNIAQ